MKRPFAVAMIALLALVSTVLVSACSGEEADTGVGIEDQVSIRISGSGTCIPLLEILTDHYPDDSVQFVFLPGLHSGGGVNGVARGDLEIGTISRSLSDEERQYGLEEVWLSSDGLAVAAHPSVGIDGLSTERLRAVYRGEYTDWSGLGGPESPLVVLDRNEEESAKVIFREHLIGALEVTDTAVSLYYESDMVEALKSTPGAIGYFSYGYGVSRGIAVDYLAIDGVQPSVRTIEDGSYGAIRPLGVVVDPTGDSHATVEAFLEWAAGPEAGSIMREQGYAPYGG